MTSKQSTGLTFHIISVTSSNHMIYNLCPNQVTARYVRTPMQELSAFIEKRRRDDSNMLRVSTEEQRYDKATAEVTHHSFHL